MQPWHIIRIALLTFLITILPPFSLPVAADSYPVQWVANYLPTTLWSGTDNAAIDLQDIPQFTPLVAIASSNNRVLVLNPATEGLAYIDADTIGPIGAPEPSLLLQGTNGALRLIYVRLATTPAAWQRGLMEQLSLPPDSGMLFIFPADVTYGFWMKNTLIPLSVAFFTDHGRLTGIDDMQPLTEDIHVAPAPYRYALEVPQGYFRAYHTGPGSQAHFFLPPASSS
ncbi:MAG: DUF192 domain-containing protein [Chloroflexi bacterium]|nr:DUF192 domain-containing protein [Chloroflexota bacterium]